MTDSVESVLQKSREGFEKATREKYAGVSVGDFRLCSDPRCMDKGKHYSDPTVDQMFWAWQASRSALEPMLAEQKTLYNDMYDQFVAEHKRAEAAEQALREAQAELAEWRRSETWKEWKALCDQNAESVRKALKLHDDAKAENEKLRGLLREATQLLKRVTRAYDGSPHLRASIAYFLWSSQQALSPSPTPAQPISRGTALDYKGEMEFLDDLRDGKGVFAAKPSPDSATPQQDEICGTCGEPKSVHTPYTREEKSKPLSLEPNVWICPPESPCSSRLRIFVAAATTGKGEQG